MTMHMLYNEVSKEKLIDGWKEGFANNLTKVQQTALAQKITTFNGLFEDVHEGEEIVLDYTPGQGTKVSIAGNDLGTITGEDFNRALLSISLGTDPVDEDLRNSLLGIN